MLIKLNDLVNSEAVLDKIAFAEDIKGKYSFKILNNIEKIKVSLQNFSKIRESVILKNCEKDEEGNPKTNGDKLIFLENGEEKIVKEITELLETDVDIDIQKIPTSALEEVKISVANLISIKYMLEQEEE